MTKEREELLNFIVKAIVNFNLSHPVRVAIDGVDTSGKTTLADELVKPLEELGRPVIRASIDKFHNPREKRYSRGKDSPEGYYFDSFNNKLLIQNLLFPLGSLKTPSYQDQLFDFKTNSFTETASKKAPSNSILLFDGVFLLRPELNPYWDIRIFLQVPFDEVLKRAKIRDKDVMGDELEHKYNNRYIPGQKIYLDSVHPERLADIVIDNTDFNHPKILQAKLKSMS